jgi:hypothetical protein
MAAIQIDVTVFAMLIKYAGQGFSVSGSMAS